MLDLDADITGLKGASYNPRRIAQDDLDRLAESIRTLGLVKPVIVRGSVLVAGHQRTKALRHLGITRAAAYRLPVDATAYDEVRFNQLHNGTDMDAGDEDARIEGGFEPEHVGGYQIVPAARLEGNMRASMGPVRAEIAELIARFGPWGGVVANRSGRVIHAAQYALAAKATRTPLTVFVISDEREAEYRAFLDKTYGVFSYEHIERQTYVQSLAQLKRLRPQDGGKQSMKSALYEGFVLPWLKTTGRPIRMIDFGAGQGDYAKALRARGLAIRDVEPFRRKGGSNVLDVASIHAMIDVMIHDLRTKGLYDVVICDSVLNAVDSMEAEAAVLAVVAGLARMGGEVFISGAHAEKLHKRLEQTSGAFGVNKSRIAFLDENGLSARFREGKWFFLKYLTEEQARALLKRFGFSVKKDQFAQDLWRAHCVKTEEIDDATLEAAIDFEFNLPLGPEQRLGRHEEVKDAFRIARARQDRPAQPAAEA